jgi:hypothetical protein
VWLRSFTRTIFAETFAFNLLMGRHWPPNDHDLSTAEIAGELGLGALLTRMPAGLLQLVGEGGWQLSHGERSRLFMARALLQGGDVMILDGRCARSGQPARHARVRAQTGADLAGHRAPVAVCRSVDGVGGTMTEPPNSSVTELLGN